MKYIPIDFPTSLAFRYHKNGQYQSALEAYQSMRSHPKGEATLAYNIAMCFASVGDFNNAVQTLNTAGCSNLEHHLSKNEIFRDWHQKALSLVHNDAPKEALAEYQAMLIYKPDDATIYNNMGICYHSLKDFNESIYAFTKSLQLHTEYSSARMKRSAVFRDWHALAEDLLQQKKPEAALMEYALMSSHNPDEERVLNGLRNARNAIMNADNNIDAYHLHPASRVIKPSQAAYAASHEGVINNQMRQLTLN